jgi:hypothetical protein
VIVGASIDAVLGYATTELGPVWRQRQPVAISRWQTLLAKWVMAIGVTVILTGLMLFTAVVILKMNAPHFASLWLLSWFAATVVAIGTLVLFAALGTLGQLVALLVFVYLALASSGGTVPLDALSGFFRFVANFEPLRQIPRRSPCNLVLRRPRRCGVDPSVGRERARAGLLGDTRHPGDDVV